MDGGFRHEFAGGEVQPCRALTGAEMLILDGSTGSGELASGSAYNPATGLWRTLSGSGSPLARTQPGAVWTGTQAVGVWRPRRQPAGGDFADAGSATGLVFLQQVMKHKFLSALVGPAILLGLGYSAQAQWHTQSVLIKPGWTAIYLHVDASYQTLDNMVGGDLNNPIQEIWLWNVSGSTLQFVTSTQQAPVTTSSQWANWERLGTGLPSTLATLRCQQQLPGAFDGGDDPRHWDTQRQAGGPKLRLDNGG